MLFPSPRPEHILLILTESHNVTDPVAVGKTPLPIHHALSISPSLSGWMAVRKRDCIHSQVDSPSPDSGEGLHLVIFFYYHQCSMLFLSIWCWTTVFPQLGNHILTVDARSASFVNEAFLGNILSTLTPLPHHGLFSCNSLPPSVFFFPYLFVYL